MTFVLLGTNKSSAVLQLSLHLCRLTTNGWQLGSTGFKSIRVGLKIL